MFASPTFVNLEVDVCGDADDRSVVPRFVFFHQYLIPNFMNFFTEVKKMANLSLSWDLKKTLKKQFKFLRIPFSRLSTGTNVTELWESVTT